MTTKCPEVVTMVTSSPLPQVSQALEFVTEMLRLYYQVSLVHRYSCRVQYNQQHQWHSNCKGCDHLRRPEVRRRVRG